MPLNVSHQSCASNACHIQRRTWNMFLYVWRYLCNRVVQAESRYGNVFPRATGVFSLLEMHKSGENLRLHSQQISINDGRDAGNLH